MATNEITLLDDTMGIDTSLIEYEFKRIHTESRDINGGGPISFDILNENAFTVPSDSYLLVEGQLTKDDNTAYDGGDEVTLTKEGILHLFREIRYQINDKDVESIFYPGICQNLLSYLLEDESYDKTVSLIHCGMKDNDLTAAAANNTAGYANRRAFLLDVNTRGTFSFLIPLRRLFGFFRDYNKVVFGTTQRLTLTHKGHSNDAIFRDNAANAGKVNLRNIYWMVPHAIGTDEVNLALMNRIRSKKQIDISYRGITCARNEVQRDTTFMWRLGARQAPEVPRYVLIAFQTDKENDQEQNSSLFDHVNLTKLRVMVNEKQYPSIEYTSNFNENQFSRIYMDTMSFKGKFFNVESTEKEITSAPGISPIEYKELFPVFVVDVSKQVEKVKHTLSEVTIHAEFGAAVAANTRVFCALISDRFIKLESDGNRLALVQ